MKDESIKIFRDAPISKAVLSNVVPSMIAMIMVLIYNLADTFFIGQTNDPLMVAAVSVATPVFLLFMSVGMLFGVGGTSLISRLLGEGQKENVKHVSSFCFWTSITIGVICMIGVWFFVEPLAILSGASEQTIGYTVDYFNVVAVSIPFLIIGNAFSNILRGEGNAKKAMVGMLLGNIVNIILDPIMILGLGWNVKGAAVATVIGNIVAGIYYMSHLVSKDTMLSIKLKDFKVSRMIIVGILAIGIPASLMNVLMSVSTIIANNRMIVFGDMQVAGLGVAMKVNMMIMMILVGLGTGVQPLLGYCFGAGNKKRYMDCLKFSLVLALGLSVVMSIICYLGTGTVVGAFLKDKEAFSYGYSFARLYILSGPIVGILFVLINAIQATGAGIPSLILSISRQGLIYIPLMAILDKAVHTPEAIAIAQPISDYLSTVLCVCLFIYVYKTKFKEKSYADNKAA